MRTVRPSIARIALIASIAVLLAACAGSASAPNLSPVGGAVGDNGQGYLSGQGGGAPAASAAPAPPITEDGVGAVIDDARIIRTGTIELDVLDVTAAVGIARDGIRAMGGYVGHRRRRTRMTSPSRRSPTASRPSAGRTPSTCFAA